jgi:hypothetical protein
MELTDRKIEDRKIRTRRVNLSWQRPSRLWFCSTFAAILAGVWTAELAAALPESLAGATARTAVAFASGAAGPFSPKAAIAAQVILNGLLLAKWKTAAAFVLLCSAGLDRVVPRNTHLSDAVTR